jgi:hypothetical protein
MQIHVPLPISVLHLGAMVTHLASLGAINISCAWTVFQIYVFVMGLSTRKSFCHLADVTLEKSKSDIRAKTGNSENRGQQLK